MPVIQVMQEKQNHEKQFQTQLKVDYELRDHKNRLQNNFPKNKSTKRSQLINLISDFGNLQVSVDYLEKSDILSSLQSLLQQPEAQNPQGTSAFSKMLYQALGAPQSQELPNTLAPPSKEPPTSGNNSYRNRNQVVQKLLEQDSRNRCNSDNVFNQMAAQKRREQQNLEQIQEGQEMSPRLSEDGITIREDYFNPDKNKLFYQVSTKQSNSSNHSNLSSEGSKRLSPFMNTRNFIQNSSILRSSFDSQNELPFSSLRPQRPKIDPFKKFDKYTRNRASRLSFDEGDTLKKQQSSPEIPHEFLKQTSMQPKTIQHNPQFLTEEVDNDFEMNIDDGNNGKSGQIQSFTQNQHNEGKDIEGMFKIIDKNGNEIEFKPDSINSELDNSSEVDIIDSDYFDQPPKKFVGFLEERSNEDGDSSEDDNNNGNVSQEKKLNRFLRKVQEFQIQQRRKNSIMGGQGIQNFAGAQFLEEQQSEVRSNFFRMLQMREVIVEQNSKKRETLRKNPLAIQQIGLALRGGGGGHFHRPDPPTPKPYNFTRRYRLEDINTVLYHDFAPEYHMHLHSPWIQNGKQGVALLLAYFFLIIVPGWLIAMKLQKMAGSNLYFAVRQGKDHDHMAPQLIRHMKENNFENGTDFLGRRNAQFYKNWARQELSFEFKPGVIKQLETHGFKF